MKNILLTLLITVFFANYSISQESVDNSLELNNIKNLKESSLVINGTSTLHDWDSKAEKTEAYILLNNTPNQIEKLHLDVEVESIANSKGSKMMDNLTHKALKSKDFPKISYAFLNAEVLKDVADNKELELIGDLTIAGKTNRVAIKTQITKTGSEITLKGSHKLLMTDYGVEPPTALFGTVKTGDEITVEFLIKF